MKDTELIEVIGEKKKVFDGYIVHLEHWDVTLPDGRPARREVARHPGAAAVVALDDSGNVLLVKQFRAPLGRVTVEIPAGKLDFAGEDRLEAAKRELREETGYTAKKWTKLTDLATTPGFCDEVIGIYLAEELTAGETDPDDDEFLNVMRMPLSEAVALTVNGTIADSKTITGLLLADKRKN